jgi:hypothetical protein
MAAVNDMLQQNVRDPLNAINASLQLIAQRLGSNTAVAPQQQQLAQADMDVLDAAQLLANMQQQQQQQQ